MAGGLGRFKSILAEYSGLAAWAVGVGAAPFVATFASLAPPWPIDIAPLTAAAQLAVLVLIYQLLNASPKRVINRVVVSSFCGVFAVSLIYITILLSFTYQPQDSTRRQARGFACTQIAKTQYADKCPFLGWDELNEVEYKPARLWTEGSIIAVDTTLLVIWTIAFMALTTLVGSFVIYQKRIE